jgi:hypothetical protein
MSIDSAISHTTATCSSYINRSWTKKQTNKQQTCHKNPTMSFHSNTIRGQKKIPQPLRSIKLSFDTLTKSHVAERRRKTKGTFEQEISVGKWKLWKKKICVYIKSMTQTAGTPVGKWRKEKCKVWSEALTAAKKPRSIESKEMRK